MRNLLVILTFCLFGFLPAEAQEATIIINGYGYGAIAGIKHECPIRANGRVEGYVGLQVSCPVSAQDAQGNFTPSTITAVSADSTRVRVSVVHVAQDANGNFARDTLKLTILRTGNWRVNLFANPILFIMGYAYTRAPDATWPQHEFPPINAVLGETFVLCAYEGGYETAVAKSYARPTPCPNLGNTILPEFGVEWTLPDILGPAIDPAAVPGSIMAKLDESNLDGLGVRHLTATLHEVPLEGMTLMAKLRRFFGATN